MVCSTRRPPRRAFCSHSSTYFATAHAGKHKQVEVNMRRLLWVTPLLFVLISSAAWADSVNIFLAPNYGFGDNFAFAQYGGGMSVILVGGTQTGFFDSSGLAPGQTLGGYGSGTVYLDFGIAQIGGVTYDLNVTTGLLSMSSITLPTNGTSNVTDPVVLSFAALATVANTGQEIGVGGSSKGTITFYYENGLYYPGNFTTPEPGTVGLIGTGLIAIFSAARRRLRFSTQPGPTRI